MAFSRAAFDAVGGFPEHVYAGEDFAFSAAAIESGFQPTLAEDATVRWRPRTTWSETARMFATYTRGDIRTKGRKRHAARLAAWTIGPALVVKAAPPAECSPRRGPPPISGCRCAALVARCPPASGGVSRRSSR